MVDVSELLARIEVARQNLRHQWHDIDGKLAAWGVKALEANDYPLERVLPLLAGRSPSQQWWLIRQLLPEDALIALESKLLDQLSPSPSMPLEGED